MSFGHAGTIVEGKEDTATEKIARLQAAGIPVVQRIDEIPDPSRRSSPSGRRRHECRRHLHRRRGRRRGAARDAELAKKLEEACPVDIFKASSPTASRSSRRTSTSACSAGSASTPHPPVRCASSSCTTAAQRSSADASLRKTPIRSPRREPMAGAPSGAIAMRLLLPPVYL